MPSLRRNEIFLGLIFMRFLALTFFGIYQLGRASQNHQQQLSPNPHGDAPLLPEEEERFLAAGAKQEKLLEIKTAMENEGMSRKYIEVCFHAMEKEADSATDRMKYECVAGLDALFAHQQKLKKFKTFLEKLRESSEAMHKAELKRDRAELSYNYQVEQFDKVEKLIGELEAKLREVEAAVDKDAEAESEQKKLGLSYARMERIRIAFDIEELHNQVEESKVAETAARHAHETALLHLKAALEDLHIPEIAIQSCFTQMGLNKDHVAEVMKTARQESNPEDAAKLNYERTLKKLREYDWGVFEPCLQAI
jgi:hypothetical protein